MEFLSQVFPVIIAILGFFLVCKVVNFVFKVVFSIVAIIGIVLFLMNTGIIPPLF